MSAQRWPALSESVLPLETWQVSQAMSANTRNGQVPHWDQAREYARGQEAQEPIQNYADRRGE
jgi:hypothetical protein